MSEKRYSSAGISRTRPDDQTVQALKADFANEKPPKIHINTIIAACVVVLMLATVIAIAALGVTENRRDVLQLNATATHMAQASSAH